MFHTAVSSLRRLDIGLCLSGDQPWGGAADKKAIRPRLHLGRRRTCGQLTKLQTRNARLDEFYHGSTCVFVFSPGFTQCDRNGGSIQVMVLLVIISCLKIAEAGLVELPVAGGTEILASVLHNGLSYVVGGWCWPDLFKASAAGISHYRW